MLFKPKIIPKLSKACCDQIPMATSKCLCSAFFWEHSYPLCPPSIGFFRFTGTCLYSLSFTLFFRTYKLSLFICFYQYLLYLKPAKVLKPELNKTIPAWLHKQSPSILHIWVNIHFPQENKYHCAFLMLLQSLLKNITYSHLMSCLLLIRFK